MDWNKNKTLKWVLVLVVLGFSLFTFLRDRGYCDEIEYVDPAKEFDYKFPIEIVPVEKEYLYENYCFFNGSKSLKRHDLRVSWGRGRNNNSASSQRKQWQEEYDNHHFNAVRTYNDAYNRIWFLPNLTMRQLGRDAWVAACSMAGTQTACQALAIGLSAMISQYGLHCLDEYDYIQDKLTWSKYHFDQCVYYANLLHA